MKDSRKSQNPQGPPEGDFFAQTVKSVSEGVLRAAKDAGIEEGRLHAGIAVVVHATVREVVEAGGSLVLGSKAVIVGALRGTAEKEAAALKTLTHASRAVIRHTAQLEGDLSASVKGLVLGAIASAKDIGVDRAQAATAAAGGALEGAEEAGSAPLEIVRRALKEDIGGVQVVLPVPIGR